MGTGNGIDLVKDTYIPVFSNKPSDYKEWRKRILLYKMKLDISKKSKEACINLMTSLTGLAWRQIEHLVDKAATDENGFDLILAELDKTFKYNDQVEMPRAFEKLFYGCTRRDGQTLLNYVADHREAMMEVEKHGVVIPDKVAGWILLRRSGLSIEQKQLIQGRAADFQQTAVIEAMYFLLGQDYRGKSDHKSWKTKSYGNRWSSKHQAYVMDEPYDDDAGDEWPEEVYYEEDAEWEPPEQEDPYDEHEEDAYYTAYNPAEDEISEETYGELEQQWEDAYATYLDARRHLSQIRASRGYYPVVALTDGTMASGPAASQAPIPPKGKGKSKGKGKGGKSYGKGKSQRTFVQKGSASARASSTTCLKCLQCPNPRATNKSSPATTPGSSPTKRAKTDGQAMMMRNMAQKNPRGVPALGPDGWFGMQDGGASSVVIGHNTLMKVIDYMRGRGVGPDRFKFIATNKTFGFGGDAQRQADWSCRLPVYICGQTGYLETFVVEGSTPLLVGRPILQALQMKMDYETGKMSILGGEPTDVPIGERGEHLIQLDDGVQQDPEGQHVAFDYITDETLNTIDNYEDLADYIDIHEYLATTGRPPPEQALMTDETAEEDEDDTPLVEQPDMLPEDDPTAVRKPITDKIVKTMHMSFNEFSRKRRQTMDYVLHQHEKGKKMFWEIYSGSGNLSKVMEESGWTTFQFDLSGGWDFALTEHRRQFLQFLDDACPDFVWLSPLCTSWSSLQYLNISTPEREQALKDEQNYQEATHLKFCKRIFNKQKREGRHSGFEHPLHATSWKTETLRTMDGFDADFDQCQYGSVLPDDDGYDQFIKKPTKVRCTDEDMALELTRRCPGGHYHLPIEGNSPLVGNRAKAAAEYQRELCEGICYAIHQIYKYKGHAYAAGDSQQIIEILSEEEEQHPQHAEPSDDKDQPDPQQRGVLSRLQDEDWQNAKRTILRLHRNLGHPTKAELIRLLRNKNASSALIEAAQQHECGVCDLYRQPAGVPVSSMPKNANFNERVQADTLWVTVPGKKRQVPVLMMSDATTRLLAARVLPDGEKSEEFIKQLECGWIRFFGPMKILQVDEHRAWSSDAVREWCTEQGIQLVISPGQAHTRLAILERRHQVTRRALTLFLKSNTQIAESRDGLVTAICYVIPQINRTPNVCGFSPIQWTLGYTPHIPGLLSEEQSLNNPAHLDPSERFMEQLRLRQEALKATSQADTDRKLRRALLRKFMGQPSILTAGDLCYYWRDAPAGSTAKLRWRGPATVVMREHGPHGPHTDIYWIAHGTVMLRAAPEHVKPTTPSYDLTEKEKDPLDSAKQALQGIRNRGVTHYIDLTKTNKRRRDEVETDEEEGEDDRDREPFDLQDLPEDRWQVSDDGKLWARIHSNPRRKLYVPSLAENVPLHLFKEERMTDIRRGSPNPEHLRIRDSWKTPDATRELHYIWTGTTTFVVEMDRMSDGYSPGTPLDSDEEPNGPHDDDDEDADLGPHPGPSGAPIDSTSPEPTSPMTSPIPKARPRNRSELSEPEPLAEPQDVQEPPLEPRPMDDTPPIPEHQRQLYDAPSGGETFQQQRARQAQQETLLFRTPPTSYGPERPHNVRPTPYTNKDNADEIDLAFDVDVTQEEGLPPGWRLEHGYLQLGDIQDEWRIEGSYLTRRHFVSRDQEFKPTMDNCPIPVKYLTKQRITKFNGKIMRDNWTRKTEVERLTKEEWTGYTRFKVATCWRRQAHHEFYNKSNGAETIYLQEEKTAGPLSERTMSLSDRMAFMEAKQKELSSFFQNNVWIFSTEKEADPERVLKARFILNWKKNDDGTPRAKARLICQGFRDPDALNGTLQTTSPTLTRVSRNLVLYVASMLGMTLFTADITTAFLQGKEYAPDSPRAIWIKLPSDAANLLGLGPQHGVLMKLTKPMYGLCDAPKAWFDEATDRLLRLGAGAIIQHPLDACLFLVFDRPLKFDLDAENVEEPKLIMTFGIHVDDLFGRYNPEDEQTMKLVDEIKKIFSFREWHVASEKKELTYCGARIDKLDNNHWKLHHQHYFSKQKPITIPKERQQQSLPVTDNERTALRGLLGALQWPATQTAPHLQAQVSDYGNNQDLGSRQQDTQVC